MADTIFKWTFIPMIALAGLQFLLPLLAALASLILTIAVCAAVIACGMAFLSFYRRTPMRGGETYVPPYVAAVKLPRGAPRDDSGE